MGIPFYLRAFDLATFRRYGLAVAAVAIATLLRLGLASKLGSGAPFILYYQLVLFVVGGAMISVLAEQLR